MALSFCASNRPLGAHADNWTLDHPISYAILCDSCGSSFDLRYLPSDFGFNRSFEQEVTPFFPHLFPNGMDQCRMWHPEPSPGRADLRVPGRAGDVEHAELGEGARRSRRRRQRDAAQAAEAAVLEAAALARPAAGPHRGAARLMRRRWAPASSSSSDNVTAA